MFASEQIPLVGVIVTDALSKEVLLLHRTDHRQWQIPGGRTEKQDDFEPVAAAMRHCKEELGLDVPEDKMHWLGRTAFVAQWGKEYSCELFEAKTFVDWAINADPLHYDDMGLHNLYRRTIRTPDYSANVVEVSRLLVRGEVWLG